MGAALVDKKYFTFEEYLEYEEHSEFRNEFYQGELFAMAGGTTNHNRLVNKTRSIAERTFLPRGCDVFSETVKLEVIRNQYYSYPDMMITCNRMDLSAKYVIKFPSLIVEVLSKSTESHDRGFKFVRYKKIPSLKYYVLISQTEVYVEVFTRIEGIDIWKYQSYDTLEAIVDFEELDFKLPIAEIYQNIVFETEEAMSNEQ